MTTSVISSTRKAIIPAFESKRAVLFIGFVVPLLFLLVGTPLFAYEGSPVGSIEIEGLSSIGRDEFLDLLDLREGEPLEPLKLRHGIQRVFRKGIFDDIQVYSDAEKGPKGLDLPVSVRIIVEERDVIRNITLEGYERLSGRMIRNAFPLQEGEILREDRLREAVKSLRTAVVHRGFPGATITVTKAQTSRPNTVDLTVTIAEGTPLVVKEVVISGAPEDDIRGRVRVAEGDIYDETEMRLDAEKITTSYRKEGYLNPSVSYRLSQGILALDVRPGKKLRVLFHDNSVISSRELMKLMPFSEAGAVTEDLIEEARRKMVSLYYAKGYVNIQIAPVTSVVKEDSEEIDELNYFFYEGERFTTRDIRFSGAVLPQERLKQIMLLKEKQPYNPELLSEDRDRIQELYASLGYLDVRISEPEVTIEGQDVVIYMVIGEGSQTIIDTIDVEGAVSIPREEIIRTIAITTGHPYNEVDLADARTRVIDAYLELGFLDVVVKVKAEFAGNRALIRFQIGEGEQTFFGETIVAGNAQTKTEVIERELLHQEGRPFNPALLPKERQRLYKLGLFTEVTVEAADRYDRRRDILIHVVEGKAGAVEFGVGYADYEKFGWFVDIGYRNLFGMNRQGSFRYEANAIQKRYTLTYLDPWFMDRELPFKASYIGETFENENIDTGVILYKLRRQIVRAGFEKKFSDQVKGELSYAYSYNKTFDVKPDIVLTAEDEGILNIGGVRAGIKYDTRDNPFDPRRGFLAGITVDVASQVLLSQIDFTKTVFNANAYHSLSKTFVLAGSFRFGLAQRFGSSEEIVPLIERFFLGGRNTVRGYAQDTLGPRGEQDNPTGGNAFAMFNAELRTYLPKGFGLVTFLDGGNVWQKIGDIDGTMRYTVGAGLRYNTPVGPLRIDYGYKLKREEGLSRDEFHFSIGHAF